MPFLVKLPVYRQENGVQRWLAAGVNCLYWGIREDEI